MQNSSSSSSRYRGNEREAAEHCETENGVPTVSIQNGVDILLRTLQHDQMSSNMRETVSVTADRPSDRMVESAPASQSSRNARHPNSFHPYKRSIYTTNDGSRRSGHAPVSPTVQIFPAPAINESNQSNSIMEQDNDQFMSPQPAEETDSHMFAASPVAGDDEELSNAVLPPLSHDANARPGYPARQPREETIPSTHQDASLIASKQLLTVCNNHTRIASVHDRSADLSYPPQLIQKPDPANQSPANDPEKVQDAKDLAAFAAWVTLRLIGRRWSLLMEQKVATTAGVSGSSSNSYCGASTPTGASHSNSMYGAGNPIPANQLSAGLSISAMTGPGAHAVGNFSTFAHTIQPSAYIAGSVAGSYYIPSASPNPSANAVSNSDTSTPCILPPMQSAYVPFGLQHSAMLPPPPIPPSRRPLLQRYNAHPQAVHPTGYREDRIDSIATIHSIGSVTSLQPGSGYQQQTFLHVPSVTISGTTGDNGNAGVRQESIATLVTALNTTFGSASNGPGSNGGSGNLLPAIGSLAVPDSQFLSPSASPNLVQQGLNAAVRFASPGALQQSPSPALAMTNPGISSASTIVGDSQADYSDTGHDMLKHQTVGPLPPLNQILDQQGPTRLPPFRMQNPALVNLQERESGYAGGLPPLRRHAASQYSSSATPPLPRPNYLQPRSASSYSSSHSYQPTPPQQATSPQHGPGSGSKQQHTLPPAYISHYTSRLTRLATLTLLKTPTPPHTTLLALHLLRRLISSPLKLPTRISTPTRMLLACLMVADALFGGERGVPARVWAAIAKVSGLKDDANEPSEVEGGSLGFVAGMKKDVLVALNFHLHASVLGYGEWMQTLKDLLKDDVAGGSGGEGGASVDMKKRTRRILDDLSVGEGRLGMDWKW
ncbi:hypothetical protein BC830DRAFT_1166730 [Chytriomyces sp. MP71]|nr:hypothetical protein BC830DRAFT_1166730 [Chytriomyces sp. MP71]